jgi:hypothetical protein
MNLDRIINQAMHVKSKMCEKIRPHRQRKVSAEDVSEKQSSKQQKLLRFSVTPDIIETAHNDESELCLTWYTEKELIAFKHKIEGDSLIMRSTPQAQAMKNVCQSIRNNEALADLNTDDIERIRGLEHLLAPEVYIKLVKMRRVTIEKVLKEQADQQKLGVIDVEKLASVSIENSEFVREWRHRIMLL